MRDCLYLRFVARDGSDAGLYALLPNAGFIAKLLLAHPAQVNAEVCMCRL